MMLYNKRLSLLLSVFVHVLLHVYARSVCLCMFMYVTFAVNAMRIFGNNRKIIGNNWTISQELWNRIIGKILSIIALGLAVTVFRFATHAGLGHHRCRHSSRSYNSWHIFLATWQLNKFEANIILVGTCPTPPVPSLCNKDPSSSDKYCGTDS